MSEKPGRNDPCSCGSGRKFKHCCEGKGRRLSFTSWVAIVALLAAAALLAFTIQRETFGIGGGGGGGGADAAEACPPGQTWSDSHGHCH